MNVVAIVVVSAAPGAAAIFDMLFRSGVEPKVMLCFSSLGYNVCSTRMRKQVGGGSIKEKQKSLPARLFSLWHKNESNLCWFLWMLWDFLNDCVAVCSRIARQVPPKLFPLLSRVTPLLFYIYSLCFERIFGLVYKECFPNVRQASNWQFLIFGDNNCGCVLVRENQVLVLQQLLSQSILFFAMYISVDCKIPLDALTWRQSEVLSQPIRILSLSLSVVLEFS